MGYNFGIGGPQIYVNVLLYVGVHYVYYIGFSCFEKVRLVHVCVSGAFCSMRLNVSCDSFLFLPLSMLFRV